MPPKQRTPASTGTAPTPSTPAPARSTKSTSSSTDAQAILQGIWDKYVSKTSQRVKLLDAFMAFLVVVGALQFLYVVVVGNFVSPHILLDCHATSIPCQAIGTIYAVLIMLRSLSTHSSRASARASANSYLRRRCAFKRIRRTRPISRQFHMSGRLQTSCSRRYCCTFSV
jgi:hypothetical protein